MKKNTKVRADQLVFNQGLAETIQLAQAYIMSGIITYRLGKSIYTVDKVGTLLPYDIELYKKETQRYVSRAGYKLEKALDHFNITVDQQICIDIGASTGGFSDCLLQRGAKKIYAVDVNTNILHERLKNNSTIIPIQMNIKYLTQESIPEALDIAVADLSFISLETIFQPLLPLLKTNAELLLLLKPQFELDPHHLHKGILKNPDDYHIALKQILTASQVYPLQYKGHTPAGIKGKKGNQEYLLHFIYNP